MNDSFTFSVCIDFWDDLLYGWFDEGRLSALFTYWKKLGASRIYWIYTLPRKERFADGFPYTDVIKNAERTYKNLGEWLPVAVKISHELGLEIYAVVKPFDFCIPYSVPGENTDNASISIKALGGVFPWVAKSVARLSKMRLRRHPDDVLNDGNRLIIDTIKLTTETSNHIRMHPEDICISVSKDNICYTLRPPVESWRPFQNGRYRGFELNGANITEPFFDISLPFTDDNGTFRNAPEQLVQCLDPDGKRIPVTLSFAKRESLFDGLPFEISSQYKSQGYVFDRWAGNAYNLSEPDGACLLDNNVGGVAVAKGTDKYISGALSPVYAEAQCFWLGMVQECLEAEVDGVDLRIANHNRSMYFHRYGFEKNVMDKIAAIDKNNKLSFLETENLRLNIIASAYTDFYRKAAKLIRSKNKHVQLHIGEKYVKESETDKSTNRYMGLRWQWRDWLREGLADEITVKGTTNPNSISTAFLEEILLEATNSPRLHICPYLNETKDKKIRTHITQAKHFLGKHAATGGFILYESAHFAHLDSTGNIVSS